MSTEFISSIESSEVLKNGVKFFDEIMVLYNLFGIKSDMKVSIVNDIAKYTFNIHFDNADDCKRTYCSLNNSDYTVYGKKFAIIMCKIDDHNLGVLLMAT